MLSFSCLTAQGSQDSWMLAGNVASAAASTAALMDTSYVTVCRSSGTSFKVGSTGVAVPTFQVNKLRHEGEVQ